MSNRIKYLILGLLSILPFVNNAQSEFTLLYEKKFTSISGAEGLLTLHKSFYTLEERHLPSSPFKSSNFLNATYRLAKSAVIDYPVAYLFGLTQHEVFGHGARFNEFNYTNCSFHLSFPPPFGKGHGFAEGYPPIYSTFDESMTMIAGGNESNSVLASALRTKWLSDDSSHYSDFFLYAGGFHNTTQYIVTNLKKSYGDIAQYMLDIEIKYYAETGKKYAISDLTKFAIINLFDPFQYMAFFNWANYIAYGKQKSKLQMIRFGNLKYLPSFQLGLTPFGAEFYFTNYLKYNARVARAYVRYGDPRFETFYGGGLSISGLLHSKKIAMDASVDVWEQPSLTLQDKETKFRKTKGGTGFCLSASIYYQIMNKFDLVLIPGYKSDGFMQGEALAKGFFLRAGFGFKK